MQTYQKCSVILVLPSNAIIRPCFVADLSEALNQMRGRTLHDLCLVFPSEHQLLVEPLLSLSNLTPIEQYELPESSSIVSMANKGIAHAHASGVDALLLTPGSTIAPDSLTLLCAVAARSSRFGLVGARLHTLPPPVEGESYDPLEVGYLTFNDVSQSLDEWQHTNSPSPHCVVIPKRLVDETGFLDEQFTSLAGSIQDLSWRAHHEGFTQIQVNTAYHIFLEDEIAPQFFLSDEDKDEISRRFPADNSKDTLDRGRLKERLFHLHRTSTNSHRSMLIDLSSLPAHADYVFDFGCDVAASIASRMAWDVTVWAPSPELGTLWGLTNRFPKAEIVFEQPERCFDYGFSPQLPENLGKLSSFTDLALKPFFMLLNCTNRQQFFSETERMHQEALMHATIRVAQGIFVVGKETEDLFRTLLSNTPLPPTVPLLPSLYWKEYARGLGKPSSPSEERILVLLPDKPTNRVIGAIKRMYAEITNMRFTQVGGIDLGLSSTRYYQKCELTPHKLNDLVQGALVVVIPEPCDEVSYQIARAMAYNKAVVTLKTHLTSEMFKHWTGPRGLVECATVEDLQESTRLLCDIGERSKLLRVKDYEKPDKITTWRWSQIGNLANDFMRTSGALKPQSDEGFIERQLSLHDFTSASFSYYEKELLDANKQVQSASAELANLKQRIREMESAQKVLANAAEPQKKKGFQQAINALQEWTARPK